MFVNKRGGKTSCWWVNEKIVVLNTKREKEKVCGEKGLCECWCGLSTPIPSQVEPLDSMRDDPDWVSS